MIIATRRTEWLPLSVASVHGQTGDCFTAAVRRPQAPAFAAVCVCVCVCIARTLERKTLGAVPVPVNQKDRDQNIDGVLWNRSDSQLPATILDT